MDHPPQPSLSSDLAGREAAPSAPALRPGLRLSERVTFPPELPITARVIDIVNAIDANPVVIVAGETGSGKTTQLPKICLAMGRGVDGQIGCTQPRRIAATSVAAHVAQDLATEPGEVVGYKVRFNDKVKNTSYVKFMSDGILLAESQGDPLLRGPRHRAPGSARESPAVRGSDLRCGRSGRRWTSRSPSRDTRWPPRRRQARAPATS
jgi:ATP-dependent helicase HrpA